MLQNPCKTLGFKKNMVYEIPPGGGGGGLTISSQWPKRRVFSDLKNPSSTDSRSFGKDP